MLRLALGRTRPKLPQRVLRGLRVYMSLLVACGALHWPAARAELPVPCGGGTCGAGAPQVWVSSGAASATVSGNSLTVHQQSDKALLNWASFNVGPDNRVNFEQPSSDAVALNRIYQADPSRILGSINANGQVYLINHNGFLFGQSARVNVHALVASSLDVADEVLDKGVFAPLKDAGKPAFAAAARTDADGNPIPAGAITVESGAQLSTDKNGRLMLLAPTVENRGSLRAPDGQVILGAGEKVWVAASDDPDVRGLMVEVDTGGDVRNVGEIIVGQGNASLVGLAVNQEGRVSATTSVNLGGSVRLLARDTVELDATNTKINGTTRSGEVKFGTGSITEVLPNVADATTAVDEQDQPTSRIEVMGKVIDVGEMAQLVAPSGRIDLTATTKPAAPLSENTAGNGARLQIGEGARLDVAGTTDSVLPMERNVLTVELRGNELRDSPLQRDGVLYGKKIEVDLRKGTPVADISGALAGIKRDVAERSSVGGALNLRSEDALTIGSNAVLDVSGGQVRYDGGWVATTRLLAGGKVYDISEADPARHYDAILGGYQRTSLKWGAKEEYRAPGGMSFAEWQPGYVEGKDAGRLTLMGNYVEIGGRLRGETVTGAWQRFLPGEQAVTWARPGYQAPLGGSLILGDSAQLGKPGNFFFPEVIFTSQSAIAETADPSLPRVQLDPALLRQGGFSRVGVYSDGRIVLPREETLRLPEGGELTLVSAAPARTQTPVSIAIHGNIEAPGGHVTLRTLVERSAPSVAPEAQRYALRLGEDARIDVSGRWINDTLAVAGPTPSDLLLIDGGTVTIKSAGDLSAAPGSRVLAHGGGWMQRDGEVLAGRGGSIRAETGSGRPTAPQLEWAAQVEAYSLYDSGTLSVAAPGIHIGAITGEPVPGTWQVDPSLFTTGGFGGYQLAATHTGLNIAPDTEVLPRMTNWVLTEEAARAPSGTPLKDIARREVLPDYQRAPVDVSLSSTRDKAVTHLDAGLHMGRGSRIDADPGAKLSLSSDRSVVIEGELRAPAGEINLNLGVNAEFDRALIVDKAVWLTDNARLEAPAHVRRVPDALGLRRGEVLPGGSVNLRAARGHLVTAPGSLIDVSGVAALFDIPRDSAEGVQYVASPVSGAAGSVRFEASDGMVLAGDYGAAAADVEGAAGGHWSLDLKSTDLPDQKNGEFEIPNGHREIVFSTLGRETLLGERVPGESMWSAEQLDALRGADNTVAVRAEVSLDAISAAGFDTLDVKARPALSNGQPIAEARVVLDANAALQARRRVSLDAPLVVGTEGNAEIKAAYVAIGPTDTDRRFDPTPEPGTGTLRVDAQFIDLIGDSALRGFGGEQPALHLNSTGDIRLRGLRVPENSAAQATGSLRVSGDLDVQAGQIYSATLSEFTLQAEGEAAALRITQGNAPGPIPLSAGGTVRLQAPNIEISGTVRAPHGRLDLAATENLNVLPGAELSVAGPAQPVLFGATQFGRDWVLPFNARLSPVLGGPEGESWSLPLPSKEVLLNGEHVDFADGARIVLDGGGDLYAWEFVPGPGGSRDVLLPEHSAGAIAIVPSLGSLNAPLDPFTSYQGIDVGDTLTVSASTPALAAGTYAVLPARFALLPGAVLLTPDGANSPLAKGSRVTRPGGLPVVAARRGAAQAGIESGLWHGYTVETGAQVRQRAEYRESLASQFFAAREEAQPRLPGDAGRLAISAVQTLTLGGAVSAATSGRGGQADIVAQRLAVVSTPTGDTERVELTASGLERLQVESLLLGARRREEDGVTLIEARAEHVSVEPEVTLTVPELLLAATATATVDSGQIRIGENAVVRGVAAAASKDEITLRTSGDVALLRVSSGSGAILERTDMPAQARSNIVVDQGAQLLAGVTENESALNGGSIALDTAGDATLRGELTLGTGGALHLGAQRISLGEVPEDSPVPGLVLNADALAALKASRVQLRSSSTIDLYGAAQLNVADELVLQSAALQRQGDNSGTARLAADRLIWQAGTATDAVPFTDAAGTLTLAARQLLLGEQSATRSNETTAEEISSQSDLTAAGFTAVRLEAADELRLVGDGALRTSGDLTLAADTLSAVAGANWKVEAAGSVEAISSSDPSAAASTGAGLGSSLSVTGQRVLFDTRALLPSGRVALHATGSASARGDVTLGSAARINVAGRQETFADVTVATPGGRVDLTADRGDVIVAAGAVIDVSAGNASVSGGEVYLAAPTGTLQLDSKDDTALPWVANTLGSNSGRFSLDVGRLDNFAALNAVVARGGFADSYHLRLRTGDLNLAADQVIRARDIVLIADGQPPAAGMPGTGRIDIHGTLDASGERGGYINVAGRGDLTLHSTAVLDTHATGADRRGGTVELTSRDAHLALDAGSRIDVRGTYRTTVTRTVTDASGQPVPKLDEFGNPITTPLGSIVYETETVPVEDTGTVRLRAPRFIDQNTGQQGVAVKRLLSDIAGAGRTELEAVRVYTDADGIIDANEVMAGEFNPLYQEAAAFMTREAELRNTWGKTADASFHLMPGIEVRSTGDLALTSAWDLASWRFGERSEPGVLTLRAAGNLMMDQSLSDGFDRRLDPVYYIEKDYLRQDASWSYRLVAGADLGSSNPLAVTSAAADLSVAANAWIRSGTGDMDLRSSGRLVLQDETSVIYSGGVDNGTGTVDPMLLSLYADIVYPVLGGDLRVETGGDILAAPSSQFINDWYWRLGGTHEGAGELPTAWGVNIGAFRQGVAAFGGGNVDIVAGGSVVNLGAHTPNSAQQIGENSFDPFTSQFAVSRDEVIVQGAERLRVRAEGNIVSGMFFAGSGEGELFARGSLTRDLANQASIYPILALGDAKWRVTAGHDAALETALNPTNIIPALQQGFSTPLRVDLDTYGMDSVVNVVALAGDVLLNQDTDSLTNLPLLSGRVQQSELKALVRYPGTLQVASFSRDVVLHRSLDMSASAQGQLVLLAHRDIVPAPGSEAAITMLDAIDAEPLHQDDAQPVRVVARDGSVGEDTLVFILPKRVEITAGEDIRNLRLDAQHLRRADVSVLAAGGAIVHDTVRAETGALADSSNTLYFRLAGPGRFELVAGSDIDLGTAGGVLTTGSTTNPFLPKGGADVTLVAGLSKSPAYDAFAEKYFAKEGEHVAALQNYLKDFTTDSAKNDLENFQALTETQQRPLILQILLTELKLAGTEATSSGSGDFSRGFAAIETLFPEADYPVDQRIGDINLLLSRITTVDGGDITLFAPGGVINAGVASTSQLVKRPEDLGIVVQRDGNVNAYVRGNFLVNQSRVFTLDGGDILIWSSRGDIDAGRGAKTAISAPAPRTSIDPETGNTKIEFPPAIQGSGIRAVVTSEGVEPGDVYLFAPAGVVSAGDAGIGSAGNVTIGAVEVIGADNIDVGGAAIGVPVSDSSLTASLGSVTSAATTAASDAQSLVQDSADQASQSSNTPLADEALSFLEVTVLGFGEEEDEKSR